MDIIHVIPSATPAAATALLRIQTEDTRFTDRVFTRTTIGKAVDQFLRSFKSITQTPCNGLVTVEDLYRMLQPEARENSILRAVLEQFGIHTIVISIWKSAGTRGQWSMEDSVCTSDAMEKTE